MIISSCVNWAGTPSSAAAALHDKIAAKKTAIVLIIPSPFVSRPVAGSIPAAIAKYILRRYFDRRDQFSKTRSILYFRMAFHHVSL
jgi:hypothetical protein